MCTCTLITSVCARASACVRAYVHGSERACVHACVHAHVHVDIRARTRVHACARVACVRACRHAPVRACKRVRACMRASVCASERARVRACTPLMPAVVSCASRFSTPAPTCSLCAGSGAAYGTPVHAFVRAHALACFVTHVYAHVHTHVCAHAHTHDHAHVFTHVYAYVYTHAHWRFVMHAYRHTHSAHTHLGTCLCTATQTTKNAMHG